MNKKELKELLVKDADACLNRLTDLVNQDVEKHNELILLVKYANNLRRSIEKGTLGFEEWSRLNNRLIERILQFIDRVFEQNEVSDEQLETESDSILPKKIANSIEWLRTNIVGAGYEYNEEERYYDTFTMLINNTEYIKGCSLGIDGTLKVYTDQKFERRDYLDGDDRLHIRIVIEAEILSYGNLADMTRFEVKESRKMKEGYLVILGREDRELLFYKQKKSIDKHWERATDERGIEEKYLTLENQNFPFQKIKEDTESYNQPGLVLHIDNLGLAKRIKDCVQYLSMYFKRNRLF